MKYYRMIIARPAAERVGDPSTRKSYVSRRQGAHPDGWITAGVAGYFEKPNRNLKGDRP